MASSKTFALAFCFVFIQAFPFIAQAIVPANETFQIMNEGEFGPYIIEYDGNYRALSVFASPFQLCFYNTTPGAFTLALRMGLTRSESLFRWVWEANRGNPVGENATLTFGTEGNLVLADADGRIAWQTGTANKGVVGFNLLPNGNMVLYDSKGNFIWQSFDHPTDTLLVGQSLRIGGPTKLVSRASAQENIDGPYSMVLEPKSFNMYYTSKSSTKPMIYYDLNSFFFVNKGETLEFVNFISEPYTGEAFASNLEFDYQIANSSRGGSRILARPNYNSTLTLLRLGMDGSLKAYTYYDPVFESAWEVTFTLFTREDGEECQLPERCGNFGLCEDSQCVGCPLPSGLMGWSKDCQPPKLSSCKDFRYYKVEGVDHFLSKYTRGSATKEDNCSTKCSSDCKCLGYFYNQDTSRCWIANDLKTLTKAANSTHVGYIKAPIRSDKW